MQFKIPTKYITKVRKFALYSLTKATEQPVCLFYISLGHPTTTHFNPKQLDDVLHFLRQHETNQDEPTFTVVIKENAHLDK